MTDKQIESVCNAIRSLGNADAATRMGGMEALGLTFKEGLAGIAQALADGLHEIGEGTIPGIDAQELEKKLTEPIVQTLDEIKEEMSLGLRDVGTGSHRGGESWDGSPVPGIRIATAIGAVADSVGRLAQAMERIATSVENRPC